MQISFYCIPEKIGQSLVRNRTEKSQKTLNTHQTTQEEEIRQELEWIGKGMEGINDKEDLALEEETRRRRMDWACNLS